LLRNNSNGNPKQKTFKFVGAYKPNRLCPTDFGVKINISQSETFSKKSQIILNNLKKHPERSTCLLKYCGRMVDFWWCTVVDLGVKNLSTSVLVQVFMGGLLYQSQQESLAKADK
jgi:hypothetical protein